MQRKKQPIQIHLTNPCQQDWADMQPDAVGRHCAHCQKTVVDFTAFTDAALYNYFEKHTEGGCGRFLKTQLQRPINIPYQPNSRLYRIAIAAGLILLLSEVPAQAKSNPPLIENYIASFPDDSLPQTAPGEIRGTVLDEKKQPIVNAVIRAFEGNIEKGGAVTNFDGNYSIKPLDAGRYDMKATYAGCKETIVQGVVVSPDKFTPIDFTLSPVNADTPKAVVILTYKTPFGNVQGDTSLQRIEKLPTREINEVARSPMGIYQPLRGAGLNFDGGRTSNISYVIDGVQANDPATFQGRILNEHKQSLPNAYVRIFDGSLQIGQTYTDEDGLYTLTNLNPGLYNIKVSSSITKGGKLAYAESEFTLQISDKRKKHRNRILKHTTVLLPADQISKQ
jgi:hypothetical protein